MRTQLAWSVGFAACALFYTSMALAQQAPADPRPPLQAPQAAPDPRPPLLDKPTQAPPDRRPPQAPDQPAAGSPGQSGHKQSGSEIAPGQGKSDAPPPRIEFDQSPASKGGKGEVQ